MKFLIISLLVSVLNLPKLEAFSPLIQSDQQHKSCPSGSLNLRKLFDFVEQNLHSASVCESGYKVELSGNCLKCVEEDEKEEHEQVKATVAKDCPSLGCPLNPTCNPGFHLLVHGNNCCCVKEDITKDEESTDAEPSPHIEPPESTEANEAGSNLAPSCPAFGCPLNPTCNPGDHLVTFETNCCCVKEDVEKEHELVDPKICPLCSSETPGDVNCSCISPLKLLDSIVDPATSCCS